MRLQIVTGLPIQFVKPGQVASQLKEVAGLKWAGLDSSHVDAVATKLAGGYGPERIKSILGMWTSWGKAFDACRTAYVCGCAQVLAEPMGSSASKRGGLVCGAWRRNLWRKCLQRILQSVQPDRDVRCSRVGDDICSRAGDDIIPANL